jgi:hypothetical protein
MHFYCWTFSNISPLTLSRIPLGLISDYPKLTPLVQKRNIPWRLNGLFSLNRFPLLKFPRTRKGFSFSNKPFRNFGGSEKEAAKFGENEC